MRFSDDDELSRFNDEAARAYDASISAEHHAQILGEVNDHLRALDAKLDEVAR